MSPRDETAKKEQRQEKDPDQEMKPLIMFLIKPKKGEEEVQN